ncbi:MAG: pyridoxamine 5'-phosphate oxidase family protein [Spirochaetia bacterium]|jgi:nitroimidazol reductase NimA-like FMN-containing flavoprotein (pyridoxamine 5'-phosphate oxidase superfamily)|nr:pyridoxamine 5'-phosphate oxidase family protein [Spirochaetia bacterium]
MRRKDRELTDKSDLLAILDEADVCRLAMQTGQAPYIVTLNFGYSWEDQLVLYFHSATEGRKLELLQKNGEVGFELDAGHELVKAETACSWGMKYRSIIGTGRISFIEDEQEKGRALGAIMRKYGHPSFTGTAGTGGTETGGNRAAEIVGFKAAELRSVKVFSLVVDELSGKQKG